MNPKVSIVVPIYNVAPFIGHCMHSLFQQSFDEIEYILVNDCTNDNSMTIVNEILKQYPKRREYTRIFNNDINKGSSTSRNLGIDNCQGLYIINIDSDDYVEKDMIEKMYELAEKYDADMVVADSFEQWRNKQFYRKEIITLDGRKYAKDIITGKCVPSIWNRLIKTCLYKQYNIRYPDGINMGEDLATSPQLVFFSKKIVKIDSAFVHYIQYNKNSYTKNISTKGVSDLKNVVKILFDFFEMQGESELLQAINIRKSITKCVILINSSYKTQRLFYNLYPESDEYIFKAHGLPMYYKTITWLFSKKCFFVANIILAGVKFSKYFKDKILN